MENMTQDQNVRIAVSFVVGIIIGVGGYWLIVHRGYTNSNDMVVQDNQVATTTDQSTSNVASPAMMSTNLTVNNQAPGSSVTIASATFSKLGWITIEDDINGKSGNILGAGLFDVGTKTGKVSLLRNTVAGKTYFVVMRSNVGSQHSFDARFDVPLKDAQGNIMMTTFTATANSQSVATPTNSPQPTSVLNSLNLQ